MIAAQVEDQQQLTTRTLFDDVRSDVEFGAFVESGERFARTTCSSLGHRSHAVLHACEAGDAGCLSAAPPAL
jgi:hypothetical protein